jgi:hypothetical protein
MRRQTRLRLALPRRLFYFVPRASAPSRAASSCAVFHFLPTMQFSTAVSRKIFSLDALIALAAAGVVALAWRREYDRPWPLLCSGPAVASVMAGFLFALGDTRFPEFCSARERHSYRNRGHCLVIDTRNRTEASFNASRGPCMCNQPTAGASVISRLV